MKTRRISIDVLRGLTIFLMIMVNTPGSWTYIYAPLRHAEWHGCTPTDMVFPSFLFVVGLSLYLSLSKASGNKTVLIKKVIKRAGIIFLIGLLLNWFPFYNKHITDLRIFGVLQRIALAFLGAGLCILLLRKKQWILVTVLVLLLGHWALLYVFGGSNPYTLEGNIGRKVDLLLFGENHMYKGFGIPFDPEGLVGTISSIAQVLLGYVIAGYTLSGSIPTNKKIVSVAGLAVFLILTGWIWGFVYPVNKPLWTGSYVLYTSGIVTLIWVLLIWVIDLKKQERWAFVFKVFGRNPLISFVISILLVKIYIYIFRFEGSNLYSWSYNTVFQPVFGNYFGSFMYAFCFTWLIWLMAYWLYRKGKIIKI